MSQTNVNVPGSGEGMGAGMIVGLIITGVVVLNGVGAATAQ